MADYFTQTSFAVYADAGEAAILAEIDEIIVALQEGFPSSDAAITAWRATSERFRRLFPADDPETPFAHFTTLFNDETYPCHGADISCSSDPARAGGAIVEVSGDQVDPFALAHLLRIVLPSALPFRFGWAETCSRMRVDAFGGGFMEVTADMLIPLHGLGQDVNRQRLVVVTRDPECGLLFWSNKTGFGMLKTATVFTPREAEVFRLPYVEGGAPGWLELPPLAVLLGDVA